MFDPKHDSPANMRLIRVKAVYQGLQERGKDQAAERIREREELDPHGVADRVDGPTHLRFARSVAREALSADEYASLSGSLP
jgi:predicted Ser/Thr protein kinase